MQYLFVQEFAAYEQVLKRDIKRISRLYENLLEVNLGATAVGTGLNADLAYIKKQLEFYERKQVFRLKMPKI